MAPYIYSTVQHLMKKNFSSPSDPLVKRMAERPELYGLIRRRVEEHLKGL